jgi:tetratricopeptide (TPR) repeat protein
MTKRRISLLIKVFVTVCLAGSAIRADGHDVHRNERADCLTVLSNRLQGTRGSRAYPFASQATTNLIKGDLKGALLYANLAVHNDSKLGLAYIIRGLVYSELEEPQKTIDDLCQGQLLDPKSTEIDAHFFDVRSWAYIDLQQWEAALADTNKSINLAPKTVWRYKQRGEIYYSRNKDELAIGAFSAGLKLEPKNEGVLKARAACYARLRRYKEAIADYSEIISIGHSPLAYGCRADVYEKLGRKDMAAKDRAMSLGEFAK